MEMPKNFLTPQKLLPSPTFSMPYIVAIIAPDGQPDTLIEFFKSFKQNENIAFIVLSDISVDDFGVFFKQIKQAVEFDVLPIMDKQNILANHIYILSPGKNLTIQQQVLSVNDQKTDQIASVGINKFLYSLALSQGLKSVCILFSGTYGYHDGLTVLREHGGLVIGQKESNAFFSKITITAFYAGLVDYLLFPKDMLIFLLKYITHQNDQTPCLELSIPSMIQEVLGLIKVKMGNDFSLYKPNTIYRRIQKRMNIVQIESLETYIYYMQHNPVEIKHLFRSILIHVTHFFRDPDAFVRLKCEIEQKLLTGDYRSKPFRVWVPACSTGEEAYAIAMIIQECMQDLNYEINVKIFATDVDVTSIEIAREGYFRSHIEKYLSDERLACFFVKEKNGYHIKAGLRKMIVFAEHNIIEAPPFIKLDLLSCRNLLIYLKPLSQKKILSIFHYCLGVGGLLMLGPSEGIGNAADYFEVIDRKNRIYKQKDTGLSFHTPMSLVPNLLLETNTINYMDKKMLDKNQKLISLVKEALINQCAPACYFLNKDGEILYIYGRAGKCIEFDAEHGRIHYVDIVQSGLKEKIQSALTDAFVHKKEVILHKQAIRGFDLLKCVNIIMRPITQLTPKKQECIVVLIEEVILDETKQFDSLTLNHVQHSEKEHHNTQDNFEVIVDTLETANQELKLFIQEIEISNEELKSNNEELQSTNEELQSLNEEITTVNTEFENRVEQSVINLEYLKNLLDHTEIATIALDNNLCVKRFTPKVTELIHLIDKDIGRPIGHIVLNLNYSELIEDARTVLRTQEPIKTEKYDKNGSCYAVKITPYRSVTNTTDGIIIIFFDITEQKQAEEKLKIAEHALIEQKGSNQVILNAVSDAAVILDVSASVLMANEKFLKQFEVNAEDVIGFPIDDLNIKLDKNKFKNILEAADAPEEKFVEIEIPGKILHAACNKLSQSNLLLTLNDVGPFNV